MVGREKCRSRLSCYLLKIACYHCEMLYDTWVCGNHREKHLQQKHKRWKVRDLSICLSATIEKHKDRQQDQKKTPALAKQPPNKGQDFSSTSLAINNYFKYKWITFSNQRTESRTDLKNKTQLRSAYKTLHLQGHTEVKSKEMEKC